jgi:hypothetical protein
MTEQRRRIFPHLHSEHQRAGDQLEEWLESLPKHSHAYGVIGLAAISDATNLERGDWLLRALENHGADWRVPFEIGPGVRSRAYSIPQRFAAMAVVFRPLFHRVIAEDTRIQTELAEAYRAYLNPKTRNKGHGEHGPTDVLVDYFHRIGLRLTEFSAHVLFNANRQVLDRCVLRVEEDRNARIRAHRQQYVGTQPNWPIPHGPLRRLATFSETAELVDERQNRIVIPVRMPIDWEHPLAQGTQPTPPTQPGRRKLFK